jgi:hypothetical protein
MAKRSTIGENPLDTLVQENPLDTVVPDLTMVAHPGRGQAAAALSEVQERVETLEAGLKTLKTDLGGILAATREAASLKATLGGVPEEVARLRREVAQLMTELAATKALATELTHLREELAQVRAATSPSDLPWWMRGKKKS